MRLLDLSFAAPEENLACDEALLDWCERGGSDEILRFWESPSHFVVLGYSNRAETEVQLQRCQKLKISVLRRCSGGGTVLQGPGCLNYSLILRIDSSLASITETNCYVMRRNRDAIQSLIEHPVEIRGHTDLAINELKFSGNSQRRRRNFLLFHGSLLLGLDLALVDTLLKFPSREPEYRHGRSHRQFLTLLPVPAEKIKEALRAAWKAEQLVQDVPHTAIRALVHDRYSNQEWNVGSR
jgi:lipoate---protein ligase